MSKEVFLSNPTINAILNYPQPSSLNVTEVIYKSEILKILTSFDPCTPNFNKIPDAIYPNNINSLKTLCRHTHCRRHSCSYIKTISGKGRYYKETNVNKRDYASLQNCYSKVRRLIVDGNLVAIDMCNAHLEIIKNLASILKIDAEKYEVLNEYCIKRNSILEDVMRVFECDREVAKNYFIIILFGGSYNTWITSNYLLNKTHLKTEFMINFETAFDIIKYELNKLDIMNGFKVLEKQVNKKKNWQIEKTALAIFLQEIESKILTIMYQSLESKNCIIRIPIHDAIWFEDCKNITNDGTSIDFLNELTQEIKNKIGLDIPLDYEDTKPNEDDLKWFENHKDFYDANYKDKEVKNDKILIENSNDDEGASKIVINIYQKDIIRCNNIIIVKENDCWTYDKEEVNRILSNMVVKSNIYFIGANDKYYSYSNAVSRQKNCVVAIRNSPLIKNDNDFIKNINIKNKTYLPYLNGIWSMNEKKLYSYDEKPNIPFMFKINRNFPIYNKEATDELCQRFINPIFPDKEEKDAIFNRLARSLAGHIEDKKWYSLSGPRNSGKSKLIKILQNAFGQFVSIFNANCLVYNPHSPVAEPAKALMWVLSIWTSRLACASEIEGNDKTIMNGNLIKRIVSGGDVIKARGHYMSEVEIVPAFTPWFMCNQWYNVEPVDTCENLTQFTCPSKFVDADKLIKGCDTFKLKDDTIDDFIQLDNIIDAFTLEILNNYSSISNLPPSIISFNTNDSNISIEEFIIKHFHKTKSLHDGIHTSHLKDILAKWGYILSPSNIRKKFETLKLGIYDNKNCIVDNVKSSGFKCLIYKNDDDDGNY